MPQPWPGLYLPSSGLFLNKASPLWCHSRKFTFALWGCSWVWALAGFDPCENLLAGVGARREPAITEVSDQWKWMSEGSRRRRLIAPLQPLRMIPFSLSVKQSINISESVLERINLLFVPPWGADGTSPGIYLTPGTQTSTSSWLN